jgi:hypothetical protein
MLRTTDGFACRSGIRSIGGLRAFCTVRTATRPNATIFDNAAAFGQDKSRPGGYNNQKAFLMPLKTNANMACRMIGEGFTSASAVSVETMQATMLGEGLLTPAANIALNMFAVMQGEGLLTGSSTAIEKMSAVMDAGARPSAFDIAQEVISSTVENGVSLVQVLRILVARAAGLTDIDISGPNPIVKFRNIANTKDVITGTMDGSKRIDIDLDLT